MEPPDPAACGLTVLRAVGGAKASKVWRWSPKRSEWSKISYSAGRWFTAWEHRVGNLGALIEKTQRNPCAFVVRGALAPDVAALVKERHSHRILRRKHAKGGTDPSLIEVPRRWLVCDIDGWPLPDWADLVDDPETVIDHAIYELLPAAFHDAECFWQLSSSAGFSAGFLKVHLFFWLSEPATNEHIKAVLKQCAPGIDRAPFNAAQPLYIAAPVIQNGHDPLPRRTGWRKGLETEVILPELKAEQPKPRPVGTGAAGRVGGSKDALNYLGDGEGLDGFHVPLRTAIMRYAGRCSRFGDRDDEAFKDHLRAKIRSAPARRDRDPEQPYCTDSYLDVSIAGAFARLAGQEEVQSMAPHHKAPGKTVAQARGELKRLAAEHFNRVLAWHALDDVAKAEQPADHSALVVDVGAGKTRVTREALDNFIATAKAAKLPHRVLWFVPTHKLGGETAAAMELLGLNVAVLRGREAIDPETVDPEAAEEPQKMCLNLPAVEDALAAGYDVERASCGTGKVGKDSCPYFSQCGYQRQKPSVARADVIIASHQSLFYALPKEARKRLAAVVVDEAWWQGGLRPNQATPLAGFVEEPAIHPVLSLIYRANGRFFYETDQAATDELIELSRKAQAVFETIEEEGFASRFGALESHNGVLATGKPTGPSQVWGQAAMAACGYVSLAGWHLCPKPEPSVPL